MKKDVKQVLVSGSWYIIGNFVIKAITFLSVSVFTRIMTLEDYGRYCTYLVYESIMTAIMGLGFAKTISVAKFEFGNKFNDYVASLAGYQTVIAVFLGVVGLNICWLTNCNPGIFAAMWIASYGNGIFQLVEQRFIIENRYVRYIGMTFLYNIPQILISICLILFWKGQSTYIERLIGHVIPLIFFFFQIKNNDTPAVNAIAPSKAITPYHQYGVGFSPWTKTPTSLEIISWL